MQASIRAALRHAVCKPVLFVLCLLPFAGLILGIIQNNLGANPAEFLIRATGDWTLRALCLVLAITPLRVSLGWPELARFRRMLGLFVYFYAFLHLLCYSGFDMGFEWGDIAHDISKRPFILVGFSGFVLLTPLALTSFNAMIRRLGAKRWQLLHKVVYLIAALAVLHFWWMRAGKHNFAEVWFYGLILGALLAWRALKKIRS
jgi:sulfoxide reductase heme-binding subunit YedZ